MLHFRVDLYICLKKNNYKKKEIKIVEIEGSKKPTQQQEE